MQVKVLGLQQKGLGYVSDSRVHRPARQSASVVGGTLLRGLVRRMLGLRAWVRDAFPVGRTGCRLVMVAGGAAIVFTGIFTLNSRPLFVWVSSPGSRGVRAARGRDYLWIAAPSHRRLPV